MWVLIAQTASSLPENDHLASEIPLVADKEYIVGRKNADIIIAEDPSISRKHASITVISSSYDVTNPLSVPELSVSDYSKFGTFVSGKKLAGSSCLVESNQEIKFGQINSVYRAVYRPMLVTTSCLASGDKSILKSCLTKLSAHLIADWSRDCMFLVMGKVTITIKAVCALASLKPIVTVLYFKELLETLEKNVKSQGPDSFLPAIAETGYRAEMLQHCSERTTLFVSISFFFLDKDQYDRMQLAIQLAGGTPLLLEKRPKSFAALTEDNSLVMYCDPNIAPAWYKDLVLYMTRRDRRVIQDAEIGHAVLHCSVVDHCNPCREAGNRLYQAFSQLQASQVKEQSSVEPSFVMAPDTQRTNAGAQPGNRSAYIADVMPPPHITSVLETQQRDRENIPEHVSSQLKRKAECGPDSIHKRVRADVSSQSVTADNRQITPSSVEENNCLLQDSKDKRKAPYPVDYADLSTARKRPCDYVKLIHAENLEVTEFSVTTGPYVRSVHTPSNVDISDMIVPESDPSVVEDSQASFNEKSNAMSPHTCQQLIGEASTNQKAPKQNGFIPANHQEAFQQNESNQIQQISTKERSADRCVTLGSLDVQTSVVKVKEEPTLPIASVNKEFCYDRNTEIGDFWDRIQVEYAALTLTFKAAKPSSLAEKEGLTLWNGKWIPNYKTFKKNGRKELSGLPRIIGGRDLENHFCSQQSQDDFNPVLPEMPVQTTPAPRSLRAAPSKTSALFGSDWDMPIGGRRL